MSPLPRTHVATLDVPPAVSAPLDSTQAFVVGETWRGLAGGVGIGSQRDLRKLERTGVGIPIYDAVSALLREGVPKVWVGRLLGPDPAAASVELDGPAAGVSLVVTAREVGEWANGATGGLTAEVMNGPAGASERVLVIYRAGQEFARSLPFTDRAGAVSFGDKSAEVMVTLGAENALPVVAAPANFVGGDADLAGMTSTAVGDAARLMPWWLGPGQLLAPGRTTFESNAELLQAAMDTHRTAYLDGGHGLSVAGLKSLYASLRALGQGAEGTPRLGGIWSQYATGPGPLAGSVLQLPWTVVVAGQTARLERQENHPNVAPVGDFGASLRWATGVTEYYPEADAEELAAAGGNVVENLFHRPRTSTFHTLEADDSEWAELAHTRLERAVRADAFDIGRQMDGKVIDGQGLFFGEFAGKFRDRLVDRWRRGALYGRTASEAFRVEVGPQENTADTIARREVHAGVGLKMSPHAEQVYVDLAKVPIGQEV